MEDLAVLMKSVVFNKLARTQNPYITLKALYRRMFKEMEAHIGLTFLPQRKTELFYLLHDEILEAYNLSKKVFSVDEQTCIERVLSIDSPHPNELLKFGTAWMKHNPILVYKWFAMDGTLGNNHKSYIQEAFNPVFRKHSDAVRQLYKFYDSPEMIKRVVNMAFGDNDDQDPMIKNCVEMYTEIVGPEEIIRIKNEKQQKQSSKKKKGPETEEQ